MEDGILAGVRILDMSSGVAGSVATMLMAEAGADVIKIEPPAGDPNRDKAGFVVWNRSKRSVALDLPRERAELDALIASADVLMHDLRPSDARKLGLDAATLTAADPQLIVCQIGGYPNGHPLEDLEPRDLLVMAQAGLLDEQQGVTRDGPIFVRFPLGTWGSAYLSAIGTVARLIHRGRRGRGGPVYTSLLQGGLVPMAMHWQTAERPTPGLLHNIPKDNTSAGLFECADGVWIHLMRPPDNAPLMKARLAQMSPQELAAANATRPSTRTTPNAGANAVIMKTLPSQVWLEDFWAHDVAAQPAAAMGEVYFDEQAAANDFVIDLDDPARTKTRQPGHPMTITPPLRVRAPAPLLNADRAEVFATLRPRPDRKPAEPAGDVDSPLQGVRVLDFGSALAGPLAPMILGDLGAEVIKIEKLEADHMRAVEGAFVGCQRNKRGLALQLKSPVARKILERMLQSTDIVHHNIRLKAVEKLGLDYASLKAIKPDLIYTHVSTYGNRGARKDWPGFDQMVQAQTGWEYEAAGEGNPPVWNRFGMMDHQAAMSSCLATLLALYRRDQTGQGQFASSSILGAGLLTVSEVVVDENGALTPFERLNHEQTRVNEAHGIYQCRDGWVALAALLPEEKQRLKEIGGSAQDLEQAFAAGSVADALARLRRHAVPCAPVTMNQGHPFLADADNRRARLSVTFDHPVYGRLDQVGAFMGFGDDLATVMVRPAPVFGQHTREVLGDYGYTDAEIKDFLASEVAADDSRGPAA